MTYFVGMSRRHSTSLSCYDFSRTLVLNCPVIFFITTSTLWQVLSIYVLQRKMSQITHLRYLRERILITDCCCLKGKYNYVFLKNQNKRWKIFQFIHITRPKKVFRRRRQFYLVSLFVIALKICVSISYTTKVSKSFCSYAFIWAIPSLILTLL